MSMILIVEDDAELAAAAQVMLQGKGHQVSAVAHASDALEAMADDAQPIDVIVLDLNLAGERGETLIHRSESLRLPQPKIIITSAEPRTDCAAALLELGAAACLTKPYSLEELHSEIEKAIAGPPPDLA